MGTEMTLGGQVLPAAMDASSAAAAALSKAEVEAAYTVALARPRDLNLARQRILEHCRRPRFAEAAKYSMPRGDKTVSGPSIRMAEAAAQALGNLRQTQSVVYDDDLRQVVRFVVTDLETNLAFSSEAAIDKTVERKRPGKGDVVLSERVNSRNEAVYLIRATEADVGQKVGAAASRAIRNAVLRLLPRDILEEAMETVDETRKKKNAEDPAAARKRLLDAFAGIGVGADELRKHAGQPLDSLSPVQMDELRDLYTAIREGQTTWRDVIAQREEGAEPEKKEAPQSRTAAVLEAAAAKAPEAKP